MSPRSETSGATDGLRERKKRATRASIVQAALALFAERGYDETTLAEVADAAGVAPRTIFAYFESKAEIVFSDEPEFHQRLEQALAQRPPGTTTVEALRSFLTSAEPADTQARLRRRIIAASQSLRSSERARSAPLERILAASIATDLDAGADDVRPILAAAATTVAFTAARNRFLEGSDVPLSHADTVRILDLALTFLRGGLQALRETT